MAQLKPTRDTGGIAAIDSGEQTPTINLKAHHPARHCPSPGEWQFPQVPGNASGRTRPDLTGSSDAQAECTRRERWVLVASDGDGGSVG
jgi:hypothetical protein